MTLPPYRQTGSALVIALALVFLLAGLLAAFLSRSILDQQIASSSASQAQIDVLAKGALKIVIGDIRQEIAAGSKLETGGVYTNNGVRIFVPLGNQTSVPFVTVGVDRSVQPNVLKESFAGQPFFSGTAYLTDTFPASKRASASVTNDISLNHRVITTAQWNAPLLMVPTGATDLSPKQAFTPPNWIIVTRSNAGVNQAGETISTTDLPNLKNKTSEDFAIGRFAYIVYDEGGLLDINIAGNGLTAAQNSQRGWLHQADLTQIPGIVSAGIPALIAWRSALTGSNTDTTAGSGGLFDPTRSFLNTIGNGTAASDQCFFSRQDLIAYARGHSDQFNGDLSALQYLSTFSREANAPSWTPATDAGSGYSYATNAEASSSTNRNLANVRVTVGFPRNDNTEAKVGEPLLKTRFPLSRISMLDGAATPSADTLTKIKNYFGLSIKSGTGYQTVWAYNHGSASSIYTLDQVASAKREPDFFELLKAAILAGSLGRDPGAVSTQTGACLGPASDIQSLSSSLDAQIIQIGANIIDQYDSDSYPTAIYFQAVANANTTYEPRHYFYGIENLPYLSRIFTITPYDKITRSAKGYIQPEVWNPHQASNVNSNNSPSQFKVVALGAALTGMKYYSSGTLIGVSGTPVTFSTSLDPSSAANSAQITFPNSSALYNPTVLSTTMGAYSVAQNMPTDLTEVPSPVMFWCGASPAMPATSTLSTLALRPSTSMSFMMEYQAADGNWYPYSTTYNITISALTGTSSGYKYAYIKADPRTDRFGVSQWANATPGSSLRPDAGAGTRIDYDCPINGFTWNPNQNTAHTSGFYLGLLSSNTTGAIGGYTGYYQDLDGIVRPGDAIYGVSDIAANGCPLALTTNATESRRPIILNRPFRSVGELGYAFRDLPWKSLDFFTTASADAALLDVFTVNDAAVLAGRININTRNLPVLEAALSGGLKIESQAASVSSASAPSTAVLSTDVPAITNAIVNWTNSTTAGQGPLLNRADLATKLATVIGNALSATPDQANKTQREATVRALADVSNTRTWNLLIDLIAQTGRYPTSATNLDQFLVEGQCRYWLHLAIDRYTGKIVAQQLEPVNQ